MDKDQPMSVKDAVYKLQLSLLNGVEDEDLLFAAFSILSRGDYEDVVTERSITNLCGLPLCGNRLPSDRPHKGRYCISLKEKKVHDLRETSMYCSSSCVAKSQAFRGLLPKERCSDLKPAKLNEVLRLFENLSLDSEVLGTDEELGLSNLTIQEKIANNAGEVSFEEWIGPSNAIEGYVPQRDRNFKPSPSKDCTEGSKAHSTKPSSNNVFFINEADFMSTIITSDEYSISKTPSSLTGTASDVKLQKQKGKGTHKNSETESSAATKHHSGKISRELKAESSKMVMKDEVTSQDPSLHSNYCQTSSSVRNDQAEEISQAEKPPKLSESMLKPSLKPSGEKKFSRSVTWADEKVDNARSRNLCEIREIEDTKAGLEILDSMDQGDGGNMLHFESAEACAMALSHAAEAVVSGGADATDAMSEAGVIILPRPHDSNQGNPMEDVDMIEQESAPLKWPRKPGIPQADLFEAEDSWYDDPPEGFSLTLSPFATMWVALFAWVTSSSLAYIYGRNESSHEDYLLVNGREYPRKIILGDGRSSEIKHTLEVCLAQAFPGLVADLRLSIPISTLEQGVGHLLDTMSFVDALPALRMKQWQIIAFLFIEALSVSRIPTLISYMTNRRMVLYKVLDGAQIGLEEYEHMKDLMIPLGRAPHLSPQSGA